MKLRQRFKRLTIWNKLFIIGVFIAFIGLILTLIMFFGWIMTFFGVPQASKSDVENAKDEILSQIEEFRKTNHSRLMAEYDLGYALFYAFYDDPVIYSPKSLHKLYGISLDWSNAKIDWTSIKDNLVTITSPDIFHEPTQSSYIGLTFGFTPSVGYPRHMIGGADINIYTDVLAKRGDFIICVLGFRKGTNQ